MSFSPQLYEAFIRVANRKLAIIGDNDGGLTMETEAPGPMFVGTDVDPQQVMFLSEKMTRICLAALIIGEVEVPDSLQSQWIDGFLTGLELGKIRAEDDAQVEVSP